MPGNQTTRKRQLSGPTAHQKGTIRSVSFNVPERNYPNDGQFFGFPGTQITVSEGHQWPPPKKADLIDRGGRFYTSKSELLSPRTMPTTKLETFSGGYTYKYIGPVLPTIPGQVSNTGQFPWPPSMESSDSSLEAVGATAISLCKPTNSIVELSTALGELVKEGLPSLIGHQMWKSKASKAKSLGSEYLNVQFGWAPLVSDISKFAKAIRKSDQIIAQYERDAGRVVRRRHDFPLKREESRTVVNTSTYVMGGGTYRALTLIPAGQTVRHRVVERRQWFSGAFTYYLPSGYESRNGIARLAAQADKLFGISITPETLWNLSPWSWAIDWFSNTGDVISNLQDFETGGLIMRYGYIMEETSVVDTYTHEVGGKPHPSVAPVIVRTRTKKRVPANPFGFGVKWEGLSNFQLSIVAALGLSRGR